MSYTTPHTESADQTSSSLPSLHAEGTHFGEALSAEASPPMSPPATADPHTRSVPALIRSVRSGQIRGDAIAVDDRRMCVEFLSAEGLGAGEIAELMQMTERTIMRDRAAIRKSNALSPDPAFASEMAGMLWRRSEASAGKLRRLARDKDTPPAAKIEAEAKAFEVEINAFQCLQRAGYLPTVGTAGSLDPSNLMALVPQLEDLTAEAARLKDILTDSTSLSGPAQAGVQVLDHVLQATARLQLSAQIESVKVAITAQAVRGTCAPSASGPTASGPVPAPSPEPSP